MAVGPVGQLRAAIGDTAHPPVEQFVEDSGKSGVVDHAGALVEVGSHSACPTVSCASVGFRASSRRFCLVLRLVEVRATPGLAVPNDPCPALAASAFRVHNADGKPAI